MTCKEFQNKIPAYIQKSMEFEALEEFLAHHGACEECKEELAIQLLVGEGVMRLEEGDVFDLQKEQSDRLKNAQRKIHRSRRILHITEIFELICCLIFLIFMGWILL